jgi:hypothetical protein
VSGELPEQTGAERIEDTWEVLKDFDAPMPMSQ